MKIVHNSRDSRYPSPFGAVTVGSEIAVAIEFEDCIPESVQLNVRKDWESGAKIIRMNECRDQWGPGSDAFSAEEAAGPKAVRYEASFTAPDEGGLLWYWFSAEFCDDTEDDNQRWMAGYGNNPEMLGGEGNGTEMA